MALPSRGPSPVYPRSHERELLRSRLRVVLGTLYRRKGIHEGLTDERLRSGTEEWKDGCGSGIFFRRRKVNQGVQTDGTDRQARQGKAPGTTTCRLAASKSRSKAAHLARMIRWIVACTVEIGEEEGLWVSLVP